jgi:ABC-2 type transport system permease protein
MRTFAVLIKREFWENRGAFYTTPIAVGISLIALMLMFMITARVTVDRFNIDGQTLGAALKTLEKVPPEQLGPVINASLYGISSVFNVVLFFVLFFYLLGSLYDDRKDRSILFWKSLPVSDAETVLSKLVTAMVVAPALALAGTIATHIAFVGLSLLLGLIYGVSGWNLFVGPGDHLTVWLSLASAHAVFALWMIPIYGWLMLASAFARSKPFLWAVLPPIILAIMQKWTGVTAAMNWDFNIGDWIGERLVSGILPLHFNVGNSSVGINTGGANAQTVVNSNRLTEMLLSTDMLVGLVIGAVLIAAAVWLRRYRDET